MDQPKIKKRVEYIQDMGSLHRKLEWPMGFPEIALRESTALIWEELGPPRSVEEPHQLESELGSRILRIIINEMCGLVDRVGRMEVEEGSEA